jgi:drug/metabolite transporter (DMT)-like permease
MSVIWGCSFLFLRVLVTAGMEPLGVSAARTVLGTAALLPFGFALRRQLPRSRRTWLALAVLGLTNFAIPWTLFAVGQQYVPSGVASITNSAQPLWAALVSTVMIREQQLGRGRIAGLLLGFVGVMVLMNDGLRNLDGESLKGIPVMVLATLFYAVSSVSIKRWLQHVPAVPLTIGQVGFAALYLAPAALVTGAFDDARMGWHEWSSLVILGTIGSGLSIVVFMWLIQQVGPVRAAMVTYLIPPVGVFAGWLLLDEPIGWNMLLGLAFIVAGVGIVQQVPVRRWLGRVPAVAPAAS